MKENNFSLSVLNSHLNELQSINDRAGFEKKLKSILSWLKWLRSKHLISDKHYSFSINQLKDIESKYSRKLDQDIPYNGGFKNTTNVLDYSHIKYFPFILIIFLLVFNIYIYRLYSGLKNDLIKTENTGRVLPFKGVIKETDGKPLTSKRDLFVNLYSSSEGGTSLYSGKCVGENGIQPEYNGAFTIMVGSDCGMSPIPEDIFRNHSTLYLGVTIGTGPELTPRYQIFTTTYSRDTSKLQGLEPGKSKSSIPFIDETGMIQLEGESPIIKSTNGVFSLEGNAVALKAENSTEGDILIQPGSESNVIIPFGKLGIGTYNPDSIVDVSATQLFTSTAVIKNYANIDDETTTVVRLSLGTEVAGTKSNFIEFFAGATNDTPGTKVGNIRINNEGVVYETAGADFAEYFKIPSSQEVPPIGSIISISSKGIHPSVPNEKIIGAISNTAGFIGNRKDTDEAVVLIALVGQVNVLVSTINGDIQIGDKIGASVIPGFGTRVGSEAYSIGYALEKTQAESFSNEKCPKSYKNKRDSSGKKIRCGMIKLILDSD